MTELLRGALVGGVIASWVLFPDDVETRVGRSLAVAAEWYENHIYYGKTVEPIAVDAVVPQDQLKHLSDRAAEVKALRVGREPKNFATTRVIKEVNAELWAADTGPAIMTRALWQAGSGDAHALGWSVLTRGYEKTVLDAGMAEFAGIAVRSRRCRRLPVCVRLHRIRLPQDRRARQVANSETFQPLTREPRTGRKILATARHGERIAARPRSSRQMSAFRAAGSVACEPC